MSNEQVILFPEVNLHNSMSLTNATPVIKWAGGKTQLLPTLRENFPKQLEQGKIDTYIEPFIGGAAVFFDVARTYPNLEEVYLFDKNPELVLLYQVLKDKVDELCIHLEPLASQYLALNVEEREEQFYKVRQLFNESQKNIDYTSLNSESIHRVALFIFLNKTCFNGLYRVNSKGSFNVPTGRYKNPPIYNKDRLNAASIALSKANIMHTDFAEVLNVANKNTFIYYDPPYRPISKTAHFNAYAKEVFNDEEQIRLADTYKELDSLGTYQLLSNSDPSNYIDDPFFDELYQGFTIQRVSANRMINSKGSKRGAIKEILVKNYK